MASASPSTLVRCCVWDDSRPTPFTSPNEFPNPWEGPIDQTLITMENLVGKEDQLFYDIAKSQHLTFSSAMRLVMTYEFSSRGNPSIKLQSLFSLGYLQVKPSDTPEESSRKIWEMYLFLTFFGDGISWKKNSRYLSEEHLIGFKKNVSWSSLCYTKLSPKILEECWEFLDKDRILECQNYRDVEGNTLRTPEAIEIIGRKCE